MDSEEQEKDRQKADPEIRPQVNRSEIELSEIDVLQARQRFLNAAEAFEPFGSVRRHPFISVGSAFAAGFGITRLVKNNKLLPLLPVGAQIAALTARLGLLAMQAATNKKRP